MKKIPFGNFFLGIKNYIGKHKIIAGLVIAIIAIGGYFSYKSINSTASETTYTLGTVSEKTIIKTVSASGQVSALNQVDIKPKVSGDIVWIGVSAGDSVISGQAIASIDSISAKQAVANAEIDLAGSKLQFEKNSVQSPIDYQNALDTLATAKDNLSTDYIDTYNTISNVYLDLPTVITGLDNMLYGYDLSASRSQWNIDVLQNLFSNNGAISNDDKNKIQTLSDTAKNDYTEARTKYDSSLKAYKATSRYSSGNDLDNLLIKSADTATAVAEALQSELNFLAEIIDLSQLYKQNLSSSVNTMQTNGRSYLSTTNGVLNNLLSQKKTIDTDKKSIITDEQNIKLLEVGNPTGNNPIDLQISKNSIAKQEQALSDLKTELGYYTIRAPFTGMISSVAIKKNDTVGTGTIVATIITKQQMALLTLNEVDAAEVAVGQKAVLTFDAIPELTLTGTVSEKDTVGTVSQGVVSYTVKISFDAQDSRVNPGMTVNASIQTAVRQNVLSVPSSAVKTKNGTSYVLVFNPPLSDTSNGQGVTTKISPKQAEVTIGISDNTNVEIISGLKVEQQIVVKTSSGSATTVKTTTTSGNRSGFGGGIPM